MAMSEPGVSVGGYRLERRVGQGGMGEVWSAVRPSDGARVALKLLAFPENDPEARLRRFETEADLGARTRHPNLVRIHGHGREGDRLYLVMELLEGVPCSGLIAGARTEPLPAGLVAGLALQALRG